MTRRGGRTVRTLAFFRKDLSEVLRQPRLLLTLVLGPFLILLAFGMGFTPNPPPLRTVLVVPPDGSLTAESEQFAEGLGAQVELVETTTDATKAREIVNSGDADVAVVVPPDAEESIRADTHAEIEVLHNRIDPIDTTFLLFFAQTGVDEINQEVFRRLIESGRAEATAAGVPDQTEEISAEVLVSPFVAVVDHVNGISIDYSTFYVPGVVALLLQHMALTFAALSLVRERTLGTTELFRVSPLSGGEVLLGKYLAYTLLGTLTGAALVAAAQFGFGFDVAGDWWWFLIISTLVLLAAQGAGFVVSGVARTESEAVQYSMILLLVAMFFSGFILSIERLIWPVRAISYLIPATYGINGLQDVAFRGEAPSPETLLGVGALALTLLVAAWTLIRRRVMQAQQTV